MNAIAANPVTNGLQDYAERIREGSTSIAATVAAYAERIQACDPMLNAYQTLDLERASRTAEGLDLLLANGTDLGPLMGVPIAVKDIITVAGMPTTNGSLYPSEHLNGPQGPVVRALKRAGCVILGKSKSVEFALGATGINQARGTPVNPWALANPRIPGGSSSGSGVAVAAGLCAFALGTDTGGSVRIPACFNGVFGHKTSVGLWSTSGVFPLCSTFDSVGPLCRSAADAAIVHNVLTSEAVLPLDSLHGLCFAIPRPVFLDDLDEEVRQTFDRAVAMLRDAGVQIVDVDLPESVEREVIFSAIVGAELLATLGKDGFAAARQQMDGVTEQRAAIGLQVDAIEYNTVLRRHLQLKEIAAQRFAQFDALLSPTCPMLPMTFEQLENPELHARALLASRNTQIVNLLGMCATSLPIAQLGSPLPVGLQLAMSTGSDARLLAVSMAMQHLLGAGANPPLDF